MRRHNLDPEALTIALLPGSRTGEIERHLPIMVKAAKLIHQAIPQTQFILPLASTAPAGLVEIDGVSRGKYGRLFFFRGGPSFEYKLNSRPLRPCGSK